MELELQATKSEIATLREAAGQSHEYTEELKQDNQRKIDELNIKWSEHVRQLNATTKGLHEDYGGQLMDCKKRRIDAEKNLKLSKDAVERANNHRQRCTEQSQKAKLEMEEKHATREQNLRKEMDRVMAINKDVEQKKHILQEEMAQKSLRHQDDTRKHASEKQMLEMKARETAHRMASLDDKLTRKRKRCEELEVQAIAHEGTLSKMKWLEHQRQDLEVRVTTLVQENELLRKDTQRIKEENMHSLTHQSIELKTKESLLDSLRSKCEVLTSRIAQLQG
jgi:chromosome segregation ATPase